MTRETTIVGSRLPCYRKVRGMGANRFNDAEGRGGTKGKTRASCDQKGGRGNKNAQGQKEDKTKIKNRGQDLTAAGGRESKKS